MSVMSHHELCDGGHSQTAIGLLLACDKMHTDLHGRSKLEPLLVALTIFNRDTRANFGAWRVLGCMPNEGSRFAPNCADKKRVDHHVILNHIFEPLRQLMCHPGGIFWEFSTFARPAKREHPLVPSQSFGGSRGARQGIMSQIRFQGSLPTLLRNHTQASRLCSQSFGNINWLTHHPWPTEIVMEKGREFALEIEDLLKSECAQLERLLSGTICKRTP